MTTTKPHYRVKQVMSKTVFDVLLLLVMIFPGPFIGLRVKVSWRQNLVVALSTIRECFKLSQLMQGPNLKIL